MEFDSGLKLSMLLIIISQLYIKIFNLKKLKTLKIENQLWNMSTKEIYVQLAKSTKIMLCFKTSSSKSYLKTSGKSCTKMTNK